MIDFRKTLWENIRDGNEQCAGKKRKKKVFLVCTAGIV
jgi:hypothetical protein